MALPTFAQIEDAIQLAVATGTGLAGANVRWANQSDPNQYQTDQTYATLEMMQSTQDDPEYTQTSTLTTVTQTATSEMYLEVRVQMFNMATTGVNSAYAKLNQLVLYLNLETTTDTIDLSTLTLVDNTPIQRIPKLLGSRYQDRATTTLRFRSLIQASSTVYTVRDVQGETTVNNIDGSHTHYPL
jgi:hypothetical protein